MKIEDARSGRFLIVVAILLAVIPAASQTNTGPFHGCVPEGDDRGDQDLNVLKNRDVPPAEYADMTLAEILSDDSPNATAMGKKFRAKWTQDALDEVVPWEAPPGVRIEGRLIAVRWQDPESCNCHLSGDLDTHMWIAKKASKTEKPKSMVVEISPRLRANHTWDQKVLVDLSKQGTRVRISGWLMWDEEHGSEVGKSRGTLWEVHPIHVIEIFQNGAWKTLD